MKNKEILVLKNKQTKETSVYQLVDNEYVGLFDKNLEKIGYFEGFDLLLTTQYNLINVSVLQSDLDWLIDILNPNQYKKGERNYNKNHVEHKKNNKNYMLQDKGNDWWYLSRDLIWSVFEIKFGDNYELFTSLTKNILKYVHNQKTLITLRFSI